jgi:NAD+ diphosphatase
MSLTQFFHTFAANSLDRAGPLRSDPAWLAEQLGDPRAKVLAYWKGSPLLKDGAGGGLAAVWLDAPMASALGGGEETLVFLGLSPADGPAFAVELEGEADPAEGPLRGYGRFAGLRESVADLPPAEANLLGTARSLMEWRRRHRFCSNCGQPSQASDGGWKRVCPACQTQHFPRVDPCVIMLATQGEHCFLGRQAPWPKGRYSTLAGFIEPGESIEEACAREVMEEAGLTVTAVRYHSCQPWPFPSQLMLGLIAEVAQGEATPDMTELEEVRRFTRQQALDLVNGKLSDAHTGPPIAISHHLIRDWAEGKA